jgi:hypothetical protein
MPLAFDPVIDDTPGAVAKIEKTDSTSEWECGDSTLHCITESITFGSENRDRTVVVQTSRVSLIVDRPLRQVRIVTG